MCAKPGPGLPPAPRFTWRQPAPAEAACCTLFRPALAPQTLNTGSLAWATALFFGYLYMVASWGGYSFIANLLPIHCLACIVFGRVSSRLYIAYAPWVILGALAAGGCRGGWARRCGRLGVAGGLAWGRTLGGTARARRGGAFPVCTAW